MVDAANAILATWQEERRKSIQASLPHLSLTGALVGASNWPKPTGSLPMAVCRSQPLSAQSTAGKTGGEQGDNKAHLVCRFENCSLLGVLMGLWLYKRMSLLFLLK